MVYLVVETDCSTSSANHNNIINGMDMCYASTYTKRGFSAADVADGTLFKEMGKIDADGETALYQLKK